MLEEVQTPIGPSGDFRLITTFRAFKLIRTTHKETLFVLLNDLHQIAGLERDILSVQQLLRINRNCLAAAYDHDLPRVFSGVPGAHDGPGQSQTFSPGDSGRLNLANERDDRLLWLRHAHHGGWLAGHECGVSLFACLGLRNATTKKYGEHEKLQNREAKFQSLAHWPGLFRILPNSVSSGSISITPGMLFAGEARSGLG